jgi:hypothetical protein
MRRSFNPDTPPPAPPVDDGPEDNYGGWRKGQGGAAGPVWSSTDYPPEPTDGDEGDE